MERILEADRKWKERNERILVRNGPTARDEYLRQEARRIESLRREMERRGLRLIKSLDN
jgi:hypothetical protein